MSRRVAGVAACLTVVAALAGACSSESQAEVRALTVPKAGSWVDMASDVRLSRDAGTGCIVDQLGRTVVFDEGTTVTGGVDDWVITLPDGTQFRDGERYTERGLQVSDLKDLNRTIAPETALEKLPEGCGPMPWFRVYAPDWPTR